ncbi:unnamed protein product, partial [marine sediment metagenome]
QLRVQDVPDTWPPKIGNVWVNPQSATQSTTFTIYAEIIDASGINPSDTTQATIKNQTGATIATVQLTGESSPYSGTWNSSLNDPQGTYYVDIYAEDGAAIPNSASKTNAANFTIIERPLCVVEENCNAALFKPLLSLSSISDAHVAASTTYFNYTLCCDLPSTTITFKSSCGGSEVPFGISISGSTSTNGNDQHIGNYAAFDNFKACLSSGAEISSCSVKSSCSPTEECVITLSDPNGGHATACNVLGGITEFPYKLCCTTS